jgi:hypothetical protein
MVLESDQVHWLHKSECQISNDGDQTWMVITCLRSLTPLALSLCHVVCVLNVLIFPRKHSYLSHKFGIDHTRDTVSFTIDVSFSMTDAQLFL